MVRSNRVGADRHADRSLCSGQRVKAIGILAFGGPEALQVVDLPVPVPGSGEVRIWVTAAAVNPTDAIFRAGGGQAHLLLDAEPPYIPGMDVAGTVDMLGAETGSRLALGDKVVGLVLPASQHGGAYAQQIVLPADSVVAAPAAADAWAASTLLLNSVTARLALNALALGEGEILAVTGAAGAVGGYVIQMAKAAGLTVIADASPADADLVRGLGADHLVQRGDDFATQVRNIAGSGAAGLVDGAAQDQAALAAIADQGSMATLRGWAGPSERQISIHPIVSTGAATDTALLAQMVDLVDQGILTLRVADVLPADAAATAHRRMAAGGVRGRLVLNFAT